MQREAAQRRAKLAEVEANRAACIAESERRAAAEGMSRVQWLNAQEQKARQDNRAQGAAVGALMKKSWRVGE